MERRGKLGLCNNPSSIKVNSFTTNLQINIDEFTFIIFCKEKILLRTWEECAETIIYEFVKNSNIDVVFDGKVNWKRKNRRKLTGIYKDI